MASAARHHKEEEPIEIGFDDCSDTDTSTLYSDTTSLSSSVLNYVYENGRRYASDRKGEYYLPNDESEQERLDILHHLWGLILGGDLYLSDLSKEVKKNGKVLDLGTGTGIWAVDFGDLHQEMEILGTDLSPIQPRWVPHNVRFEVDDFTEDWVFSEPFDFIHIRNLIGSAIKDWTALYKKIYDNTTPGGYLEVQEIDLRPFSSDNTFETSAYAEFTNTFHKCGEKLGIKFDISASEMESYVKAAGFTDVQVTKFQVPVGIWPKDKRYKEMGIVYATASVSGLEAYGLKMFTNVLGWSQEKAKDLCERALQAINSRKTHGVVWHYIVTARRPAN